MCLKSQSTMYDHFLSNRLPGDLQYTKNKTEQNIPVTFTKCHCETDLGICTNK